MLGVETQDDLTHRDGLEEKPTVAVRFCGKNTVFESLFCVFKLPEAICSAPGPVAVFGLQARKFNVDLCRFLKLIVPNELKSPSA